MTVTLVRTNSNGGYRVDLVLLCLVVVSWRPAFFLKGNRGRVYLGRRAVGVNEKNKNKNEGEKNKYQIVLIKMLLKQIFHTI